VVPRHVGVWAVKLAPLAAGLSLDPAALGAVVTVAAAAGLVTPVRRRGAGRPGRPVPGPGDRLRRYRDRVRAAGPGRPLRSWPLRPGVATAVGYGAFIVSPLAIGLLAQATSLRLALALLVVTSMAIAGLATRWPTTPDA
jgi:hypothetical protein